MESFSVNHLLEPELDYELAIRSVITNRNVSDKRKILNKLLKKERDVRRPGSHICLEDYNYDFRVEEEAINKTITSITDAIIDFEGSVTDSGYARIKSRIIHLLGRVSRLIVPEEEKEEILTFKRESQATCFKLESDLDDKVTVTTDNPNVSLIPQSPTPVVNVNPVVTCNANKQPISTWGVKFSGDPKKVFYFLERVSDLSRSRNVSDEELFNSAVELFVGDAFIWYRSIRSSVSNWNSLVDRLKKDFLPPYSDDEIWESIRNRKQKRNEPVTIYIAYLENLFNRLSPPIAEVTKIKYLRKNLLPEYIHQLALQNIDSVSTLSLLCRKLEEAGHLANKKSSNSQISYLSNSSYERTKGLNRNEPGVSSGSGPSNNKSDYREETSTQNLPSTSRQYSHEKSKIVCFNCQRPGHAYRVCKQKRKTFCYRCGESDFTVHNCPKCTKN